MRLSADQVERAFIQTAREQNNGEPFNWARVAVLLDRQLQDNLGGRSGERPLLTWPDR